MRVLGVDGCKRGWVGVVLNHDGHIESMLVKTCDGTRYDRLQRPLQRLLDAAGPIDAVGVDVPIGLVARGKRRADLEAHRTYSLRSSLFWTPPHDAVIRASSQSEATVLAHAHGGPGASAQLWNIRERILEARSMASNLLEIHPETSFRVMAETTGIPSPTWWKKREWGGFMQRLRLLEAVGIDLTSATPGDAAAVPIDDVVDAAAAAWSARRAAHGEAIYLGREPDAEIAGIEATIVA